MITLSQISIHKYFNDSMSISEKELTSIHKLRALYTNKVILCIEL
mgnify:CR=1 FL=1